METYSEQIIKAYNNWMDKAQNVQDLYSANHKKEIAAEKRAGNKFENLCKQSGLNYIKVANDLCPNKI